MQSNSTFLLVICIYLAQRVSTFLTKANCSKVVPAVLKCKKAFCKTIQTFISTISIRTFLWTMHTNDRQVDTDSILYGDKHSDLMTTKTSTLESNSTYLIQCEYRGQ